MFQELGYETIAVRIGMALLVGGILGIERESKKQPAGFRTYMLVCLGAAMVMMTNQYISDQMGTGDPSRLGAQVVSGIGFLGAGTIIVTKKSQVRGLTTAAGLWTAACLGLSIGIGFYKGAILGGIAILLIMTVFQKIDYILMSRTKIFKLYINLADPQALNLFIGYCREQQIRVMDMQVSKAEEIGESGLAVIITLKTSENRNHIELLQEFSNLEGLRFMEEI